MAARRQLILTALAERLKAISIADGYQTDAGLGAIWLGQDIDLDEKDPGAVLLISAGVERFVGSQAKLYSEWPLSIKAVVKADLDDPLMSAEGMIADTQKAVELDDRTLGGLVNWNGQHGLILDSIAALEREPGSPTVGIEVVYIAKLQRSWGDPS